MGSNGDFCVGSYHRLKPRTLRYFAHHRNFHGVSSDDIVKIVKIAQVNSGTCSYRIDIESLINPSICLILDTSFPEMHLVPVSSLEVLASSYEEN